MLGLNVKSDYPSWREEGRAGAGVRQREKEAGVVWRSEVGGRGVDSDGEEGLRQQCAEPMAFPSLSSWPTSGEDGPLSATDTVRTLAAGRPGPLPGGVHGMHYLRCQP